PSSSSNLAEIGVPCASLALSPPCKVAAAFFIAAAKAASSPPSAQAGITRAAEKAMVATSRIKDIALGVIVSLLPWDTAPQRLVPLFKGSFTASPRAPTSRSRHTPRYHQNSRGLPRRRPKTVLNFRFLVEKEPAPRRSRGGGLSLRLLVIEDEDRLSG